MRRRRPPDNERGRRWREPRIVAHMWHCGDDVCDCVKPQVDLVSPNRESGYPWVRRKKLWEGSFRSTPSGEEYEAQSLELWQAMEAFGIPPTFDRWDGFQGQRPLTPKERGA